MAYQSVGIGSNCFSSETFPASVDTKISTDQIRQSDMCSIHQSPGGDPIKQVMHENMAFVESGNRESFDLTGSPYRWEGQCLSGSIEPEKDFSNRMVLEDGSGAEYFLDVGSPIDGSVCIQTEPSNEDILQLVPDSRSICDRCSLNIVGEHVCLCLPSHLPHSQSTETYVAVPLRDNTDSPTMAEKGR